MHEHRGAVGQSRRQGEQAGPDGDEPGKPKRPARASDPHPAGVLREALGLPFAFDEHRSILSFASDLVEQNATG
jgi:hypothetical protein